MCWAGSAATRRRIESYRKALAIAPNYAPIYSDLGNAQTALGRLDEALASHDMAVKLDPRSAQAHYNRGITLFKLARPDAALRSYNWAILLDRNHAEAHSNRGDIFRNARNYNEALAAYDRAIAINPNLAEAWRGRGIVCVPARRYEEAIAAFDAALQLKPELCRIAGMAFARENAHLRLAQFRCRSGAPSRGDAKRQARGPFRLRCCRLPSSAAEQAQCARSWIAEFPAVAPLWRGEIYPHDRIRVAYLSSDFRDHAVAHLTAGLFEEHDRSRFEITALSLAAEEPAIRHAPPR